MIKKRTINILIGASIILLLSNVLIDVLDNKEEKVIADELTAAKIDSIFLSVIEKFDLKNEWIEIKNIKNDKIDSLKHVFYLKFPGDIPLTSVLKEMNYGYYGQPVNLTSEERVNNGKTVLKIYSNNYLKLQAFLNINNEIEREYSRLAFILKDADELNEEDFIRILRLPYPFAVLLRPQENSLNLLPKIYEFRKEVLLLIDDEVNEKKYSLERGFEKLRLKNSILSIISDFPKVSSYLVDSSSELYNSTSYNYIKDEFTKRDVNIKNYSEMVDLDRESILDTKSLIEFYAESGKSKGTTIFIISAENYLELERTLSLMYYRGTKYPYPSTVTSRADRPAD